MICKKAQLRDVSFFLCVCVCVCVCVCGGGGGGECNSPAEVVSKNFLPLCRIHLKFCPPPLEDERYSVVSSIGYAVTVGHCLA